MKNVHLCCYFSLAKVCFSIKTNCPNPPYFVHTVEQLQNTRTGSLASDIKAVDASTLTLGALQLSDFAQSTGPD